MGFVLHPADLATNKVLALAGRFEARDFVDVNYLHHEGMPLGLIAWAACGKDPGLTPTLILDQCRRFSRLTQLARFFESILISCGLAGVFSDYSGSIY